MKIVLSVCISMIVISLIFADTGNARIDPDVVGMWLFDESSGEIARDSSGKGNDGKIIGNPKWVNGMFGRALECDGEDDGVEVAEHSSLKWGSSEKFTKSAWIMRTGVTDKFQVIIQQERSHIGLSFAGVPCNTDFEVYSYLGGSGTCSGVVVEEGLWYHVAVVYDNTDLKLYVNGELRNEVSRTLESQDDKINYIGRYADGGCFNGLIDEVVIFDSALTEADIKDIMGGFAAVFPAGKLTTTWAGIRTRD